MAWLRVFLLCVSKRWCLVGFNSHLSQSAMAGMHKRTMPLSSSLLFATLLTWWVAAVEGGPKVLPPPITPPPALTLSSSLSSLSPSPSSWSSSMSSSSPWEATRLVDYIYHEPKASCSEINIISFGFREVKNRHKSSPIQLLTSILLQARLATRAPRPGRPRRQPTGEDPELGRRAGGSGGGSGCGGGGNSDIATKTV